MGNCGQKRENMIIFVVFHDYVDKSVKMNIIDNIGIYY